MSHELDRRMKIVSLWQPWASLFAGGRKAIETRSWRFPFELPCVLAIHAAKCLGPGQRAAFLNPEFAAALAALGYGGPVPLGAVVGVVRIKEVIRFTEGMHPPPEPEALFGDFRPGRWGWVADKARLFARPIPLRGQQGIWEWTRPDDVELVTRITE